MPTIDTIDDFKPSVVVKIKLACEKKKHFSFHVYDKAYKLTHAYHTGVLIKKIETKDFDYDPDKVMEEIIKIRKETRQNNKKLLGAKPEEVLIRIAEAKQKEPQEPQNFIEVTGLGKYGIVQDNDIELFMPKTGASTVATMGSGQTGKSTLMMHIFNKYYDDKKHINILYTHSPQIKLLQGNNKNLLIREGFNEKDEGCIQMQKYINQNTNNKYLFMNFFDDIIDNKFSKTVDDCILIFRNSLVSTFLSTQYPYLISRKNRNNINSTILFRFHNMGFLEEVIKDYLKPYFMKILGPNASKDDYIKLYQEATEDHGFMYISPFEDRLNFIKLKL
jgi:hypothetical protein